MTITGVGTRFRAGHSLFHHFCRHAHAPTRHSRCLRARGCAAAPSSILLPLFRCVLPREQPWTRKNQPVNLPYGDAVGRVWKTWTRISLGKRTWIGCCVWHLLYSSAAWRHGGGIGRAPHCLPAQRHTAAGRSPAHYAITPKLRMNPGIFHSPLLLPYTACAWRRHGRATKQGGNHPTPSPRV